MTRGFQYRGGARTGKNPECQKQVVLIAGVAYFTTYRLACHVASMVARKRKTWLGRHWRQVRPLVQNPDGTYRLRSGTTDA